MRKTNSVIDYSRTDLAENIWSVDGEEVKLNPEIKLQILDIVESAMDDFDIPVSAIEGLFVYGSILTNQYNDKTDVDCRILLNKEKLQDLYPDLTGEDIFDYLEDQLHGTLLGDTQHPLNCSVVIEGEQEDLGKSAYDAVYDVVTDKLIKGPVVSEEEDPYAEFSEERQEIESVMEKLDELLRDEKNKVIDYDMLKEAIKHVKNPKKLEKKLEEKVKEIEDGVEELVDAYEDIKEDRNEAFQTENTENPHKEPGNIRYKFLERYQYLDMLKKLKKIFKSGIDEDKIPEIETVLKVSSKEQPIYVRKIDFYIPGIAIWLVDGKTIRDLIDVEFTLAGNECRYDFIPKGEIWIEDLKNEEDVPFILIHELYERSLMLKGMDYEAAHEKASELERACRSDPGELPDALENIIKTSSVHRKASFVAYHGSDNPDITQLESREPEYAGGLGDGVYISKNFDTAAFYGKYVYILDVFVSESEIFDLSVENQEVEEDFHSVLVGENVPAFYFSINGQRYFVTNTNEDYGTAKKAAKKFLESVEGLVNEDVFAALTAFVDDKQGIPDEYDIQVILEDIGQDENEDLNLLITTASEEAKAWQQANEAVCISLDDIGGEVAAAGYKGVYFERAGTAPDEILIFDEANVQIREVIDSKSNTSVRTAKKIELLKLQNFVAYYERKEDVPPPPEVLYHASPYAKEILEQGFIINPEKQVFGGHGTYVSTTNLEEAKQYADDLRLAIGFLNDEIGWNEIENELSSLGFTNGVAQAISEYAGSELRNTENWRNILPEHLKDLEKTYYSQPMYDYFLQVYKSQTDFLGKLISDEHDRERRWEFLRSASRNLKGSRKFTLFVGDIPSALIGLKSNDVGVLEVVHAPVETETTLDYKDYAQSESKSKYTYNESENEWRFYDTTDLWPVRIVGQQKEYPQKPLERGEQTPIPEPIGYVYHVSPYAKEILEQGFLVDPTKTVLGAFGAASSISTTNYTNAILYRDGIRFVVGMVNGELDWNGAFDFAKSFGATDSGIADAISYLMKNEFLEFFNENFDFYKLLDKLKQQDPKANVYDVARTKEDFFTVHMPEAVHDVQDVIEFVKSTEGTKWAYDKLVDNLDFYNNPISSAQEEKRKWAFIKTIAYYSNLPVVLGETPEHLKSKKMDDVQIVEVAVAPVEFSKRAPSRDEQGKGKYTYVFSEEEWRFYDVTDLWPIRIID